MFFLQAEGNAHTLLHTACHSLAPCACHNSAEQLWVALLGRHLLKNLLKRSGSRRLPV